jgi:Flp pilus assembly protein TadB
MVVGKADRYLVETLLGPAAMNRGQHNAPERPSKYAVYLKEANIAPQWVHKRLGVIAVVMLAALYFIGLLVALAVLACGALVIVIPVVRARKRRRAELDRDLPTLLTTVASSVRAGLDPLSAVVKAREYFAPQSILAEELNVFSQGLAQGGDEGKLIDELMSGVQHPDVELFRSCLALSRRHGTSLADPLHRITRVVRQRQSFRRKIRAALAMHRLSAIGIAGCALIIGIFQGVTNFKGLLQAWEHPVGSKILMGGILLMVSGVWWMMTIGKMEES